MSNKHEREPWVLGGCSGRMVTTPSGYVGDGYIADVDTKDNARRIVACVNACRGLPTDELEQKGLVAAVGTQLLELEQQRDELLAALEEARTGLTWYQNAYPEAANGSDDEAMTRIDAAIANAKGGAA